LPLSEDFARWREDPMTRRVFQALRIAAMEQHSAWEDASWGGQVVRGDDLERLLRELRTRADAYQALEALTFEQLANWLGIEDAE
jgi:hypothetical protein